LVAQKVIPHFFLVNNSQQCGILDETCLKFLTLMHEVVKISDSNIASVPHNGVSQQCAVHTTFCDTIPHCQEIISLCNVYGSCTVDVSTTGHRVNRMTAFETGKVKPSDLPRLGHPVTAISPEMLQCDAIACEDGRSTTQQLALGLLILKGNVNHIIKDRGYWKACI
jgi:hypothetical protein